MQAGLVPVALNHLPASDREVCGHTELGSAHRHTLFLPLRAEQGKESPDQCTCLRTRVLKTS